jgi:sugar phosphate isomerase/epimerase
MRLGVSTWCFRNEPFARALERISTLGVRYVELLANGVHLDPRLGKPDVEALAASLRANDLEARSLHMPFAGVRVGDKEPMALNAWLGLVKECLPAVEKLGIRSAVIHPQIWATDQAGSRVVLDTVDAVLEEILPQMVGFGGQVLLENLPSFMFPSYWQGRHFLDLFEKMSQPGLGMCFDISHCIGSGLDLLAEIGPCLPWVREIHVSDNRPNSGVDLHLPIQDGETDWRSLIALLRDHGFEGNLILEIDGGQNALTGVGGSARVISDLLGED